MQDIDHQNYKSEMEVWYFYSVLKMEDVGSGRYWITDALWHEVIRVYGGEWSYKLITQVSRSYLYGSMITSLAVQILCRFNKKILHNKIKYKQLFTTAISNHMFDFFFFTLSLWMEILMFSIPFNGFTKTCM